MSRVGIYIDANTGNLGIGTTAPRQYFDIQGGGAIISGNVGIGTTIPLAKLHVNGIAKASTLSGIGQGFAYMEVLTSGTSWTIPSNVYRIKVTVVGGGGGSGGGGQTTTNANGSAGGGGGSGGVCIGFYNVTPDQSMTYAIGSGGTAGNAAGSTSGSDGGTTTTTYGGVTFTATGGKGGAGSDNGGTGGNSGDASGGTLNLSGVKGGEGLTTNSSTPQLVIPIGGSTPLGLGLGGRFDKNNEGGSGIGYGSGASGAMCTSIGTGYAGGTGADGVVIVEY